MLLIGPLLAAAGAGWASASGLPSPAAWTTAVLVLCAAWWVTEAIPIPATSLIPLAVLPLVGVLTPADTGRAYGDPLILLMLGGFLLSTAMERSGAHRRLALGMVSLFGASSGRRLVGGFMLAAGLLSMWISNMATTLMLLPIALAVLEKSQDRRLATALLLGVAFAASIGGIGTPIGTPPNVVFLKVYGETMAQIDPSSSEITFVAWMQKAVPVAAIMGPLAMLWLTRRLSGRTRIELPEVGRWRTEEVRTLVVFALTALLWVTRREPFGGWSELLGLPGANDASVALLAVVVMFIVPNGRGEKLLDWETASQIPWGTLLLYGGGIAIAKAFTSSGLDEPIGASLATLGSLPTPVLIGLLCLLVTFLTEFTSNTATTTLLMPVLAAAAVSADVDPMLMMLPATLSASFAFMLPVATPPNAVVFGSGHVTIREMVREGFALNLIGVVVVTATGWWLFG